MGLAIISTSFASILALTFVVIMGFTVNAAEGGQVTRHILFALPAMIISMFAHSMTLFYFIGTGSQIKELAKEKNLPKDYVDRTKHFKRRVFPWAMYTMLAVMLTFILGGGVHTGSIPAWVHRTLAFGALLMSVVAAFVETEFVLRNVKLADEVLKAKGRSAGS
jgi:hypothetical protein